MSELTNDVAVVTGGTRGIGRAVVTELAEAGATTIATYAHDEDAAATTAELLDEYEQPCGVKRFDVRDFEAVTAAFSDIQESYGPPSILVNNAGVMRNSLLVRMDLDEWHDVIDTNLTGTFYCMRAAVRAMLREREGRIVNVGSVAADRGWAGQANYAASKAGVVGLTKSAARELGDRSIRVNAVCPGYVDTDLFRSELDGTEGSITDRIPQERVADPDEIAAAVRFLVSPDSSYVTGEVLRVDGGLLG